MSGYQANICKLKLLLSGPVAGIKEIIFNDANCKDKF